MLVDLSSAEKYNVYRVSPEFFTWIAWESLDLHCCPGCIEFLKFLSRAYLSFVQTVQLNKGPRELRGPSIQDVVGQMIGPLLLSHTPRPCSLSDQMRNKHITYGIQGGTLQLQQGLNYRNIIHVPLSMSSKEIKQFSNNIGKRLLRFGS